MSLKQIRFFILALLLSNAAFADVIKTIQAGATDQTVTVTVIDSATGVPSTDLAYNSSGIDLEYWIHGANSPVDITEATQTVNGAHSDGGFVHIGHGEYRLDLPDAAVASGTAVQVYGAITGEIVIGGTVQLVAYNPQDTVRLGLTALPNAAADAAGGLVISDAGGLDIDGLNTNVNDIETDTADMQPKLGTPAGASLAADLVVIDNFVDGLESAIGTPSDFGSGTSTIAANLQDLADNGTATFDRSTDSLQAIRDRGDAAWTTGGAGADPSIQSTTVASVTSQTLLVPTATPTFVDQINGWAVYLEDAGDADAYHLTKVTDYNQSTGVVTIETAAPFTVASSDTMVFLPAFLAEGVDVTSWNGTALSTTNPLPNAAPAANGGLPTVNASNQVAGVSGNVVGSVGSVTGAVGSVTGNVGGNVAGSVASVTGAVGSVTGNVGGNVTGSVGSVVGGINTGAGTITTLDGLDTAQDTQHGTTQTYLTNNLGTAGAAATEAGGTGDQFTGQPWNAAWDAEVQSEATDALNAYDPPTNTEMTTAIDAVPTVAEILAGQVESQDGGYDLKCALATLLAYAAGEVSTTAGVSTYQDPGGNANRIVGTVSGTTRNTITITCP